MTNRKKIFHSNLFKGLFLSTLTIVTIFSSHKSYAQSCEISIDTDIPVCKYQMFELSVPECESCTFEWKQDGNVIGGSTNSILVSITDQTLFTVTVTDDMGTPCESEPFLVTTHPDINIELEQLQLTCTNGDKDNGNTAILKATANGFFEPDEYHYFWDVRPIQVSPGDSTVALGLKANQNYSITVKDNYGCFEKDTIFTVAFENPDIELFADPEIAYVQRPQIEFSFVNNSEDTIPLSNFFWDFNDDNDTVNSSLSNPIHRFILNDQEIEDGGKEFLVYFTAINEQGCDTIYTKQVKVVPMRLFIPNVFTPGSDGVNDVFKITEAKQPEGDGNEEGLKVIGDGEIFPPNHYYESTKLVVFNRHGRVIFRDDNYQNDWDGGNLPDGVYYYVLEATGPKGTDVYKGSVSIIRGN